MKKIILSILVLSGLWSNSRAQSPAAVNYQAALRNPSGNIMANEAVVLRLSVLQESTAGASKYSEEHNVTSNAQGMVNVQIGKGSNVTGELDAIIWGDNSYFLKVEMQQNGVFVTMGTSELVSVPYALYSNVSGSAAKADSTGYATIAGHSLTSVHADTSKMATEMKLNDLVDVNASAPVNGQVLQWDGTEWKPANNGAAWSLSGNNGTSPAANFLGTIDSNDLVIRTDSMHRMRITASGGVLWGDSLRGEGKKVIWNAQKGAFRAGMIDVSGWSFLPDMWNADSLGIASFATGQNTKATGFASAAFGRTSIASGEMSIAMGSSAIASGYSSVGIGGRATGENAYAIGGGYGTSSSAGTEATGWRSFAIADGKAYGDISLAAGWGSMATGSQSTAIGSSSEATEEGSFAAAGGKAYGLRSIAIGPSYTFGEEAIAIGLSTQAHGSRSMAMGGETETYGRYSVTMGTYTRAHGASSLVIGTWNDTLVAIQDAEPDATTPLFIIGNGGFTTLPWPDNIARSNAFAVYKSGNATLAGTLTQSSDRRLKKDIQPLQNALGNVAQLQGVTYHWNGLRGHDTTALQYGLIAQELEAVYPGLVTTESNGYKSINYVGLVPVLLEAIKELKSDNSSLKAENTAINQRLDKILDLLEHGNGGQINNGIVNSGK